MDIDGRLRRGILPGRLGAAHHEVVRCVEEIYYGRKLLPAFEPAWHNNCYSGRQTISLRLWKTDATFIRVRMDLWPPFHQSVNEKHTEDGPPSLLHMRDGEDSEWFVLEGRPVRASCSADPGPTDQGEAPPEGDRPQRSPWSRFAALLLDPLLLIRYLVDSTGKGNC